MSPCSSWLDYRWKRRRNRRQGAVHPGERRAHRPPVRHDNASAARLRRRVDRPLDRHRIVRRRGGCRCAEPANVMFGPCAERRQRHCHDRDYLHRKTIRSSQLTLLFTTIAEYSTSQLCQIRIPKARGVRPVQGWAKAPARTFDDGSFGFRARFAFCPPVTSGALMTACSCAGVSLADGLNASPAA